jgi:hypothetical protein
MVDKGQSNSQVTSEQGDQMILRKIVKNVTQPIFCHKYLICT